MLIKNCCLFNNNNSTKQASNYIAMVTEDFNSQLPLGAELQKFHSDLELASGTKTRTIRL